MLPRPLPVKLPINNFQGLNVERGVLVRPINSFTRLENFDLVKPGVLRKAKGNRILTLDPAISGIVGFRDYQKTPSGPELLIVVDDNGNLYTSGMNSDPITLVKVGELCDPPELLDEAPFIVALPFQEDPEDSGEFDRVQYIVVTLGTTNYPQYYDGLSIYRLGIDNPGDLYTVPYQNSIAAPQILLEDTIGGLGDIFLNTTPEPTQGIPISVGRQYRASYYNPLTGHDSSLFPLSLEPYPIEYSTTPSADITKVLGRAVTTNNAPYLMAQALFIDNLPNRIPLVQAPIIQNGYTKIRIWATRDGGTEFYLVPRLYDEYGAVVTAADGSIDISGMAAGFPSLFDTRSPGRTPTPIYDGFTPIRIPRTHPLQAQWFDQIKYNELINYSVNGGGQTGSSLNVTNDGGANTVHVLRGVFMLPDDDTMYHITAESGAGPNYTWSISPALHTTPANNANIQFLFIKPVADTELVLTYADTPGPNSDRQNDPPPYASWGAVYQNRLFLVDANDKTRLVYSRIGHYEDFPPDNVFRFIQADYDPITAVLAGRQVGLVSEGADQRLVVGKPRSSSQITGTDISNFELGALFPETGIVHKRAAIVVGGFFLAQTRQGLEVLEGQRPIFIGSFIKDIIDATLLEEFGPCFATDRRDNQLLLGIQTRAAVETPAEVIDSVILMREPRYNIDNSLASPFSTLTIPTQLGVIQESGFGTEIRILAGAADGNIYQLLTGTTQSDGDPVVAIAETQLLPQEEPELRKIFRKLRFEGNLIDGITTQDDEVDNGWFVQFSPDEGNSWTEVRQLLKETLIGLTSKTLKIRLIHSEEPPEGVTPMLSNFSLEFTVIGEARG